MKFSPYILAFAIFALAMTATAQETAREAAIEAFKQGDIEHALPMLERESAKNKSDAELANYLGLAYLKIDKVKKGRESLEQAVALEPGNNSYRTNLAIAYLSENETNKARREIEAVLGSNPRDAVFLYLLRGRVSSAEYKFDEAVADADRVLAVEPYNPRAHTVKADALFRKYIASVQKTGTLKADAASLHLADKTLENCVQFCKNNPELAEQVASRELISAFLDAVDRKPYDLNNPPSPASGTSPVKIISKPFAKFTSRAKDNGTSGKVRLLIVLGADGRIPLIIILNKLPDGLDQAAIDAAKAIKFEPRMKNGKAVTTVAIIEYSFWA